MGGSDGSGVLNATGPATGSVGDRTCHRSGRGSADHLHRLLDQAFTLEEQRHVADARRQVGRGPLVAVLPDGALALEKRAQVLAIGAMDRR
jgi:hypothetical protein